MSGAGASTSGRCYQSPVQAACMSLQRHHNLQQSSSIYARNKVQDVQLLCNYSVRHSQKRGPQLVTCAQQSERPVMEQMESELITSTDSSDGRSNGSKAPKANSATNVADCHANGSSGQNGSAEQDSMSEHNGSASQNGSSRQNVSEQAKNGSVAHASQDEENSDAGAQTKNSTSSNGNEKAAARVPGGITDADSDSTPKPASFWLPHPEPGDLEEVHSSEQCVSTTWEHSYYLWHLHSNTEATG